LGVAVGGRVFIVTLGAQPFEGNVAVVHVLRVRDGGDASRAEHQPNYPPRHVARGRKVGADGLDRVVRDAGISSDNLTEVHFHGEVLVCKYHYYEHGSLYGVNLAIHVQIFHELFVPHSMVTFKFFKKILILNFLFNFVFNLNCILIVF
jgi:hypothetical protein